MKIELIQNAFQSLSIGCTDDMIQTQIEHYSCFATLLHSKGNFNSLIDLPIGDCTESTSLWKRCVPHIKSFIICTYSQDTKGKHVNTCPRIQRPYLVKVPSIRRTISNKRLAANVHIL